MSECRDLTLAEMLRDPIVVLLMTADGVDPDDFASNLRTLRERCAAREEDPAQHDYGSACTN